MNKSLSISAERVEQPATDPLEERTWAAIRIYAGSRCVTRWMKRDSGDESDTIYVPVFAIAQWIVRNWWFLFNETCPTEIPPHPLANMTEDQKWWMYRHCLRSADAGLFLPRFSLWTDGRQLCAGWSADPEGSYDCMPGVFLYGSLARMNPIEVEDSLREFVSKVLQWVEGADDPRVQDLTDNWNAINSSTEAEASFARSAARMGLDPYALSAWPTGLPELLETTLSDDLAKPLALDFLTVARQATALPLWEWVQELVDNARLDAAPGFAPLDGHGHAGQAGVLAARQMREELGLDSDAKVNVEDVSKLEGFEPLQFESHNHCPDTAVKGAVGWRDVNKPVIVGPAPSLNTSRRFVEARGLFHALFTCQNGPRLVTRGRDWDQQASRGFAAELLAPRAILMNFDDDLDTDEQAGLITSLAQKYEVDPQLIQWQLVNAKRVGYLSHTSLPIASSLTTPFF